MHIIVPMSGRGKRFLNRGYGNPKPLIHADGKPFIEHVVNLFPGEERFTFVCNREHLERTRMVETLKSLAARCRVVGIEPHSKGPVFAVSQVFDCIEDDEETIVNYCDFGTYWDYADFLDHTRNRGADGAVVAYKGFHPHMLGTTNYAFMRDRDQWMLEIREKKPFTDNRMNEYASNGTYYFRKGSYVKEYFPKLMSQDINVEGEFYVSMVFNLMIENGLRVSIYEIQHMLQWGTPEDLEEYERWSSYFKAVLQPSQYVEPRPGSINLIPMAGRGVRFSREGFKTPKPFLPVSGKPMFAQALASFPAAERTILVCLKEHLEADRPAAEAVVTYPQSKLVCVDEVTEGQAITCSLGLKGEDPEAPLFIGACDHGLLWDGAAYETILDDGSTDGAIFTFRNHPAAARHPHMYGWVETDGGDRARRVSVKAPISANPFEDHAVVGAFYFRRARYFHEGLRDLISANVRVRGEFYVDSLMNQLIQMGYLIRVFQVDFCAFWGTPDEYRTFQYWQSFFHKCAWHPYRIEDDPAVDPGASGPLDKEYRSFGQRTR